MANIIQINGKNVKDSTAARMASLAPVEASTTATAAHAVGALFWLDGTLYEATAAIAVDGTITVGTNCKVVDINNMAQPDWNQPNTTARDYIKNKPAIRQQANGGGILENGATSASGQNSHAEGGGTTASGQGSHAEGSGAEATGNYSHAEGGGTKAIGEHSHAEGAGAKAIGSGAHAEGSGTTASTSSSHAEGESTTASGGGAHSEGGGTTASGNASHAEGGGTVASGAYSHAEGTYTTANHMAQHVFGMHNVPDSSTESSGARGNYIEIVGNGFDTNRRSNARTLDWEGNEEVAGDVIAYGCGGANPISLADLKSQMDDVNDDLYVPVDKTSGVEIVDNNYICAYTNANFGAQLYSTNYKCSAYIDCSNAKSIIIDVPYTTSTWPGVVFYDQNKSGLIGYTYSTQGVADSDGHKQIKFDRPANAVYVRYSILKTNESYNVYKEVIDRILLVEESIPETPTKEIDLTGISMVSGKGIIYSNGAELEHSSTYCASDFINLNGHVGETLKFLCTSISSFGYAFYKSNKTYLIGGQGDELTLHPKEINATIPDGACWVRITGSTAFSTDIEDYGFTTQIDSFVTNDRINAIYPDVYQFAGISCFEKFGVIGDSYASGVISGHGTYYNLSWGQNIARMCGVECTNFSFGGATTKSWLTNTDRGLPYLLNEEPENLYFLNLGLNDNNAIAAGTYTLGSVDDIHDSDPTLNPDTFYGNYGKIISNIMSHAPNAKIVICTCGCGAPVDTAIPVLAEHFSIPLIDILDDAFFTSAFYRGNLIGNHPIAVTYSGYALGIMRLFNKCVQEYTQYFVDYIG